MRKIEETPPEIIKLIKVIFPKKIREFVRNLNVKKGAKSPVPGHIKRRIKKDFKRDVLKLEKVINKDLKTWIK